MYAAPTTIAVVSWAVLRSAMVCIPPLYPQYGYFKTFAVNWLCFARGSACSLLDGLRVVAPARSFESALLTGCKYNSMRWITRLTRR